MDDRVRVDGSHAGCETFGMSKIPVCREEITPEWLVVQLSGIGECKIARLDHEELTGHNPDLSQVFRTRIEYAVRTPEHPDVVIVKGSPRSMTLYACERRLTGRTPANLAVIGCWSLTTEGRSQGCMPRQKTLTSGPRVLCLRIWAGLPQDKNTRRSTLSSRG